MSNILAVKSVHDYNAFVGHADQHPLVSVIEFAQLSQLYRCRCHFGVYALFLHNTCMEGLTYGYRPYDYKAGTLICRAPGQTGGAEYDGKRVKMDGWALLFHPDLLHGTPLAKQMSDYAYFSYQVSETLYINEEERDIFISLLKQIEYELGRQPDVYQDSIVVSYIELILKHCKYFYNRQFATRKPINDDILARFEKLLSDYYNDGKFASEGIPSVAWCAQELCLSPNYFSDLVRNGTGETAINHIRRAVVDIVKNKLANGDSMKEITYELGFEYPQHLTRMFKRYTGETPQEFCNRIKKKI